MYYTEHKPKNKKKKWERPWNEANLYIPYCLAILDVSKWEGGGGGGGEEGVTESSDTGS